MAQAPRHSLETALSPFGCRLCPESRRKRHPGSNALCAEARASPAPEDTGPQLLRAPPASDGTFPATYGGGTDSPGVFPGGSDGKESACNAGDLVSIPESGRPPGEGIGNPLLCSCLENPMDRGAWQAASAGLQRAGREHTHTHTNSPILQRSKLSPQRRHTGLAGVCLWRGCPSRHGGGCCSARWRGPWPCNP